MAEATGEVKKPAAAPAAPAAAAPSIGMGARLLPYAIVWLVMMYARDLFAGGAAGPPSAPGAPPAMGGAPEAMLEPGRGLAAADRDAADEEFAEFEAPARREPVVRRAEPKASRAAAPEAALEAAAAALAGDGGARGGASVLIRLCTS